MNFRHILFLSAILSLNFLAIAQVNSEDISAALASEQGSVQRQIIAGDKLLISIRNVRQLSGGFNVDPDGFVDLQLIGKVKAAGQTPAILEAVLSDMYGQDYLQDPFIRIEITGTFRENDILPLDTLASNDEGFGEEISNPEETEISAIDSESSFVSVEGFFEPREPLSVDIKNYETTSGITATIKNLTAESGGEEETIFDDNETVIETNDVSSITQSEVTLGFTEDYVPLGIEEYTSTREVEIESRDVLTSIDLNEAIEKHVNDFSLAETNWTFQNDSRAFIQFLSDGEIAGFTGCNNFYANYEFEDTRIDITFLAMTFNACDDVKDGEFQEALESITEYQFFSPDELKLLDQDNYVVLSFLRGFDTVQ